MKLNKLFLTAAIGFASSLTGSMVFADHGSQTTCTTYSQGLHFQETDYNYSSAMSRTVAACRAHYRTVNRECESNVRCSGQNPPPPYPTYCRISAYRQGCYSDLCTYQISWRTGNSNDVL